MRRPVLRPASVLLVLVTFLTACSHGSKSNSVTPVPPSTYTVGGTVAGLTASGLQLANGSDTVTVNSGDTTFTLPTAVAAGATYSVTVKTQPAHFNCTLSAGSGTIGSANVTSVQVSCAPIRHNVGGTVSGLTAAGLTLHNGSDTLNVAANATTFTFPTMIAETAGYSVSIASQPSTLSCTITSASGTVGTADVTTVQISCTAVIKAGAWSAASGVAGNVRFLVSDPSTAGFFLGGGNQVSHYTAAGGWAAPVTITATATMNGLGADAQGNAYALLQPDSVSVAYAAFTPTGGWSGAQAIGAPSTAQVPPIVPAGSSLYTQQVPAGLAVFGDGSATALILSEMRVYPSGNNTISSEDDRPYYRANASANTNGAMVFGAVESAVPGSSSAGQPYQYTANGATFETRYYYATQTFLPADALVQAPTARYHAVRYQTTTVTLNGAHDSLGNPLADTRLQQGVILFANGVGLSAQISDDALDSIANTRLRHGGIAVSNNGTALAVWSWIPHDHSGVTVSAARFDGANWIGPHVLYSNSGNVQCGTGTTDYSCIGLSPVAAVNDNGDGVIFVPTVSGKTMAIRVDGKTGAYTTIIDAPPPPETNTASQQFVQALLDPAGNAYVLGDTGVYRLAAGATTFDANPLLGPTTNNSGVMALDVNGYPMAVWLAGVTATYSRYQ
jgi:hypothetical protein